MVKSAIIQTEKPPRLEQVVFIDLETTDLIYEIDQTMPYTLQFSAVHEIGESFDRLVMPSDEHFTIDKEATKVNGWTKESFLKAISGKALSFAEVWSEFLNWLG